MRVIIDIGTPKTGSTYRQGFFAKNREKLSSHDIYLPSDKALLIGHENPDWYWQGAVNHTWVVAACAENPHPSINSWAGGKQRTQSDIMHLAQEALNKNSNSGTTIISSEYISAHLRTPNEISTFKNVLLSDYSEFQIIFWVRHPVALAASAISTLVKSGGVWSGNLEDIWSYLLKPDELMNNWGKVFGHDNITVRPYYEHGRSDYEIMSDFFLRTKLSKVNYDRGLVYSDIFRNKSEKVMRKFSLSAFFNKTFVKNKGRIGISNKYNDLFSSYQINHLQEIYLPSDDVLIDLIPDINIHRFMNIDSRE